jgi:hypothetical protein
MDWVFLKNIGGNMSWPMMMVTDKLIHHKHVEPSATAGNGRTGQKWLEKGKFVVKCFFF